MSGGDSKHRSRTPATPATPAAPATPGNLTIPPFMGNNQALIAQQLAMGFGGLPSQYTSPLFQPMTIPNYAAGAPLAPSPAGPTVGSPGRATGRVTRVVRNRDGSDTYYDAGGNIVEEGRGRSSR